MSKKIKLGSRIGDFIFSRAYGSFGVFINATTGDHYKHPSKGVVFYQLDNNGFANIPEDAMAVTAQPVQAKKADKIEFFRYARPMVYNKKGELIVDNLQGVTFKISLDYANAKIKVGVAVCNGDNFDKEMARYYAARHFNKNPVEVNMPQGGVPAEGVVLWLLENHEDKLPRIAVHQLLQGVFK